MPHKVQMPSTIDAIAHIKAVGLPYNESYNRYHPPMKDNKQPQTAEEIVRLLAFWSIKYPRNRIYGMSKVTMDDELVEIENLAKAYMEREETIPTTEQPETGYSVNASDLTNHPATTDLLSYSEPKDQQVSEEHKEIMNKVAEYRKEQMDNALKLLDTPIAPYLELPQIFFIDTIQDFLLLYKEKKVSISKMAEIMESMAYNHYNLKAREIADKAWDASEKYHSDSTYVREWFDEQGNKYGEKNKEQYLDKAHPLPSPIQETDKTNP